MVGFETLPIPAVKGGAVERGIQEIIRYLSRRGIEIHVISIADEKITPDVLEENSFASFHYVQFPPFLLKYPIDRLLKGWYFYRKVGKLINQIDPDIVHYRNYPAAVYVASKQYRKKYKNIINFHNMDYGWNFFAKRLDRFLFGKGFRKADYCITVSDYIKSHVLERYGKFLDGNIITIHNGVNIEVFKPRDKMRMRKTLGIAENDPLLLFAGRIDPRKGLDTLLDAFISVQKTIKNLKLVVIGPMGSFWHKKPQEFSLHIKKRIEDTPGVILLNPEYNKEKLSYIYSMADAACLPSEFPEGLPLTALEMQACGVPVLATDAGGIKEAYIDGETGFFVRQKDSEDLAEKIKTVILDSEIRKQLSINARKKAEENYSWEVTADKLIRIYKMVLDHGKK